MDHPRGCGPLGAFLAPWRLRSQTLAAEWLWQAVGAERSSGLIICDRVLKDIVLTFVKDLS